MAIVPKNSPAKRKAAKPASTRQFFSAIDPYYKKLKAACKAGVNPKNPAMQYTNPTAHALGLSLLGHPNMDEKELGKDWQTWAETYPEKADRIRQEVFDMKAADNRRFVLHFHDPNMKPKTAPGKPFILLHPDYTDGLVPKEMISCKTKDAPAPAAPTEKEARKVGRPRGSKNRTKVEMSAVKQIKADKKQKRENRRPAQKQKAVAGEVSEDDASDLELDEDATNDEPEATPDDESDDDSIKDSSEQIENDDDTDAGSVAGCSEDAGDDCKHQMPVYHCNLLTSLCSK